MTYRERAASPALRAHVECYWTLRADRGAAHRVLPDGCIDVLFDLQTGSARVIGTMTTAMLATDRCADLLGVRFRPAEAPSILGIAAHEITDRAVGLDEVWGAMARDLAERVASAPTGQRLLLVDAALTERLGNRWTDFRIRRAVAAISTSGGAVCIPALARSVGLGERQLERLFAERVGVGPKRFARVIRLKRVVSRLAPARPPDWASEAASLGFADQAHLVREVRALCGIPPTALWRERTMSEISNPGSEPSGTSVASDLEDS